jgi:peptidoglycan/LPS O-acetylase OafA/YrhL
VSVFFGKISYSFYLWNVLFINLLTGFREALPAWLVNNYALSGILLAIPIVLITIPLSQMVYGRIELPGIKMGKTVSDRIHAMRYSAVKSAKV